MKEVAAIDIGTEYFGGSHPLQSLTGVGGLVTAMAQNMFVIAGVIFVFIVVYAGIGMVGASGDPQQYARAQTILTTGVVGLIITASAWFIIYAIETIFGITILS